MLLNASGYLTAMECFSNITYKENGSLFQECPALDASPFMDIKLGSDGNRTFQAYFKVAVTLIGSLGNSFTTYVFWKSKKMEKVSCMLYFLATACYNTICLTIILLGTLDKDFGLNVYGQSLACHFLQLLSRSSSALGVWCITLALMDRLGLLTTLSSESINCIRRHSKLLSLILGLLVLTILLNISILFASVEVMPGRFVCVPLMRKGTYMKFQLLSSFCEYFLPWGIAIYSMLSIVYGIQKSKRSSLPTEGSSAQSDDNVCNWQLISKEDKELTRACLVHGFVSLVFSLPFQSVRFYDSLYLYLYDVNRPIFHLTTSRVFFQYPYFTQFATHIFVCLLCVKAFRAREM